MDDVTLKEDNLGEKFGNILSGRRQSLFAILGDKMQFYHSRLIDGELSHLEKLMKVLRSKKREMRLQRLEGEEAKTEEEKNEEENERKEENEIKVKIENEIQEQNEKKEQNEEKVLNQKQLQNEKLEQNEKNEQNEKPEQNEENEENKEQNLNPQQNIKMANSNLPPQNFWRARTHSLPPLFNTPAFKQRSFSCIDFKYFSERLPDKKKNPSNIFASDIHSLLSFKDLSELTSLNIFKKKLMKEYNPVDNSFSFKLNNRYLVTLRSFEERTIDKTSFFHQIPYSVMQNYIFPCFSAHGLFYLRQVSSEWRELIRTMWHKTFQREMHEQLYAADLCQEIECNFRLIALRTPFVHKFAIFLKALAEILDWEWMHNLGVLCNDMVDIRVKMILYSIFRILGNRPMVNINNLNEMSNEIWETMKPALIDGSLKNDMNNVIDSEFYFESNADLSKLREKFVNAYGISISSIGDVENKNNIIILSIYLKQLFLFALLKNSVFVGQKFLYYVKDVLKKISDLWPQKKGFLEGAYKILLFKNVKFVQGQIVVTEDDDGFYNNEDSEENKEEEHDSKNNFMNLMSTFKDPDKPDFVIKKRGTETRIYLDDGTKAELILNSILSFSTRSLGKLLHLAKETKEKIEMINHELKREEMLKQEKKRLEMMMEEAADLE